MKKNDLLKAIGICFLIFAILSWIIPTGSYGTGEYVKAATSTIGFTDLFYYPIITFGTFIQYGILFLILGGFYGVINKTGVYKKMVDATSKKFKGKEKRFLILTIIGLSILSSLTGTPLALFTIIPFFMAVIMSLGYNKMVAFVATIISVLVGNISSIYGVNMSHVNHALALDVNNNIIAKIVLLAVLVFLLIMFVLKKSANDLEGKKKGKASNNEEIPLLETVESNKKSFIPLALIFGLLVLLLIVGMYSWNYNLGITLFDDVYTKLTQVTIKDYPIIQNIIGDISPFGYWDTYEMCFVLIVASLLIGWIYSINLNDIITSFASGAKKMLKVAFFVVLANVVFTLMISSSDSSILNTINNYLLSMSEEFNIGVATLISLVGSFFYNNFYYLSNVTLPAVKLVYKDPTMYGVFGILFQSIHSLTMLILPTSFIMIAGLSMLDISFKDWVKYIWKYLVQAFVIILIVAIIMFMIV